MDLLRVLFLGAVFLFATSLIGMLFLAVTESRYAKKRTIRKRLLYMSAGGGYNKETFSIYKRELLKNAGFFERLAYSFPRLASLDRMLIRAGIALNASTFIFVSLALAAMGACAAQIYMNQPEAPIAIGLFLLVLPSLYLRHRQARVLAQFQEQFPEALDFLARALRSGHALTGGFEMVAKEMDDPLKTEFAVTVDEINLGLSFNEALEHLCTRIPSRDLRFFAITIQIQKETGGNIAEILDNISTLIRERVKFHRLVNTLTAEGRLSAIILLLLPITMGLYLYLTNYEYISLLWSEQMGMIMIVAASIGMIFGALVMKKIVAVEL
ncbi:type II secretion system F family protein [Trichloromonas sp.]|uniref:type II secretion system F family protein n=1 Tax=Trichloromonas sp. TaxID=3069249 RepID=UPI003D81AD43